MQILTAQRASMTLTGRQVFLRLAVIALLALLSPLLRADNAYPMVMVHGFTGWGPGEMGGIHYWGGRNSIPAMLTAKGHPAFEGVVGPVASNWDRACELYAYIKGGRVDYGAAHAARYGHNRYGRTFPGLLPAWGERGDHQRVHLVGHSQGGQTIRVLAALLAHGDDAERAGTQDSELHPLFSGGQSMVMSITTLSTPHDGSTLATMLSDDAGYLLSWLLALSSYVGNHYASAPSYDFKLDQWGLVQEAGEGDQAYRNRLLANPVWEQQDISVWDLRPAGARLLNSQFPTVPSVYYFSWATRDSVPGLLGNGHVPAVGMNLALITPSIALGRYRNSNPEPGLPNFDESWWPNDGVVNTVSMAGPRIGSPDHIVNLGDEQIVSIFKPGVWHFMGELTGWDHLDIVGLQTRLDVTEFYASMARLLAALPMEDTQ